MCSHTLRMAASESLTELRKLARGSRASLQLAATFANPRLDGDEGVSFLYRVHITALICVSQCVPTVAVFQIDRKHSNPSAT